jgi:hypothetical protein
MTHLANLTDRVPVAARPVRALDAPTRRYTDHRSLPRSPSHSSTVGRAVRAGYAMESSGTRRTHSRIGAVSGLAMRRLLRPACFGSTLTF